MKSSTPVIYWFVAMVMVTFDYLVFQTVPEAQFRVYEKDSHAV